MEAAAYTLVGTAVGAAISGAVGLIGAWIQTKARRVELQQQEHRALRDLATDLRREKAQRYAAFLSAFWQEARFVSEMLEHLTAQRPGWSNAIHRINTSEEHRKAIGVLNESLGWLSLLCENVAVETEALALSAQFDRMLENFGKKLEAARVPAPFEAGSVATDLQAVCRAARELSAKMRTDARTISIPSLATTA